MNKYHAFNKDMCITLWLFLLSFSMKLIAQPPGGELPSGWYIQNKTSQSMLIALPQANLLISPILVECEAEDALNCLERIVREIYRGREPDPLESTFEYIKITDLDNP